MHLVEKKEYFAKLPILPEDTDPAICFEAAGKEKSV